MSNSRTIRRALDRQTRKLEQKQLQVAAATVGSAHPILPTIQDPQPQPLTDESDQTLRARINAQFAQRQAARRAAANQANALKSTGPVTSEGKAASSRNALKHGLTGNTVLLDSDDATEYQSRLDYYTGLYQPESFEERRLVQAIHDATWRLDRVTNLESTIYAKGRIELSDCFEEIEPALRKSFIQFETSQRYAKDLRNLALQESRIQRQRAKDLAALKELQAERCQNEDAAKETSPAQSKMMAKQSPTGRPETVLPDGFVFSSAKIELGAA
jgi:hypothetical protein